MDTNTVPQKKTLALVGLVLALLLGCVPWEHLVVRGDSMPALMGREALFWAEGALVLVWLRFVEKRPLGSIGLRPPTWKTLGYGLLTAFALILVFVVHFGFLVPHFHLDGEHAGAVRNVILARPLWYRVLMVFRASVVEEILYRGYLIEKVREISGSAVLALLVSVAAFTCAHISGWGAVQLIPVAAGGLIFALFYVWKRDLPSNMLAHFITDGIGFLLGR